MEKIGLYWHRPDTKVLAISAHNGVGIKRAVNNIREILSANWDEITTRLRALDAAQAEGNEVQSGKTAGFQNDPSKFFGGKIPV